MLNNILAMTVFAAIGAISPGPVNLISAATAATFGWRGALPYVVAASLTYGLMVFSLGIGVGELLRYYPALLQGLTAVGAAFLLYLAWYLFTLPVQPLNGRHRVKVRPGWVAGGLAQGLNPKAWLVSLSGIAVYVAPQEEARAWLLVFSLISCVMCLLGVGSWALAGQLIRRYCEHPRQQLRLNRGMAILLALTVISMLITG